MAKVRLLKDYNLQKPGDIITVPANIASILVLQRKGEIYREPHAAPACLHAPAQNHAPEGTGDGDGILLRTTTVTVGNVTKSETVVYRDPANGDESLETRCATLTEAVHGLRWALEQAAADHQRASELLTAAHELIALQQTAIHSLQGMLEGATPEKSDLPTDAGATTESDVKEAWNSTFWKPPYGPGQAAAEEYRAGLLTKDEVRTEVNGAVVLYHGPATVDVSDFGADAETAETGDVSFGPADTAKTEAVVADPSTEATPEKPVSSEPAPDDAAPAKPKRTRKKAEPGDSTPGDNANEPTES